jgi:hypothetical protein
MCEENRFSISTDYTWLAITSLPPFSYSTKFLQVITPSGESAWAIVLEYVKGVTLNCLASDTFPDHNHPLDENFSEIL